MMCTLWVHPAGAQPQSVAPARQAPAAMPDPGTAEAGFVAQINDLRAARGLAPLSVDAELTAQARQWAANMAGQGRIFHSGDLSVGISADWQKLGENVGVGGEVGGLFQAFVDSPTHLENLVDPAYTRVGVGVVVAGDRMYTAHRFMALSTAPAPVAPSTRRCATATTASAADRGARNHGAADTSDHRAAVDHHSTHDPQAGAGGPHRRPGGPIRLRVSAGEHDQLEEGRADEDQHQDDDRDRGVASHGSCAPCSMCDARPGPVPRWTAVVTPAPAGSPSSGTTISWSPGSRVSSCAAEARSQTMATNP